MRTELKNWSVSDIPESSGGLAVITGSTEGIGFEDALALSSAGWKAIITDRTPRKGDESVARLRQFNPKANVSFERQTWQTCPQ